MYAKCIENKHGNANFVLGKTYKIISKNRIECEFLYLNLKDIKIDKEFEFALCKFKIVDKYSQDNTTLYKCLDCKMVFEEEENCKNCPDCNSTNLSDNVSEQEYDNFLNLI